MFGATTQEKASTAPFLVFLGLILLGQVVCKPFEGRDVAWMLHDSRYWVNPLQTIVCGALILHWRRYYDFSRPRQPILALIVGVVVLVIWIAPQAFLGFSGRYDGFDPFFFGASGPAFWLNISLRFLKLAVVVPIIEEIFWRGFLLRWVIDVDFTRVPFGTFSWPSFLAVTAGFVLEHQMSDWPAAVFTGMLYNFIAYRTKSLTACILSHAATNLLLGVYVLHTGQWGFW